MNKSAGLAIICNNKILLVHPTNAVWKGRHSIPKGGIDKGETKKEAAIRETFEEIGLSITKNQIESKRYKVEYISKKGKVYKKVYYYIVRLNEEPELKKENYQLDEVDWAGFFTFYEAKEVILPKQLPILKHIL